MGSCDTNLARGWRNGQSGSMSSLVQREANTLAYIDGFWLTVWFAIAALICVSLMSAAPPGPFTPKPRS